MTSKFAKLLCLMALISSSSVLLGGCGSKATLEQTPPKISSSELDAKIAAIQSNPNIPTEHKGRAIEQLRNRSR
jgi:outer membrane murein-binding lipoprotein Lpp